VRDSAGTCNHCLSDFEDKPSNFYNVPLGTVVPTNIAAKKITALGSYKKRCNFSSSAESKEKVFSRSHLLKSSPDIRKKEAASKVRILQLEQWLPAPSVP
jgi:hypothetical protein